MNRLMVGSKLRSIQELAEGRRRKIETVITETCSRVGIDSPWDDSKRAQGISYGRMCAGGLRIMMRTAAKKAWFAMKEEGGSKISFQK